MDTDIESLQSLVESIHGIDIDLIKKRHIFYIWMNFHLENMSFFTFYETSSKTMSSDYVFFIENYVKHNYILLYRKGDKERLRNYINIMKGQKDIIIDTYIEDNDKIVKRRKKLCCF